MASAASVRVESGLRMRPAAIQGGDERRDLFVYRHRSEPTNPHIYRLVALACGHSSSPPPLPHAFLITHAVLRTPGYNRRVPGLRAAAGPSLPLHAQLRHSPASPMLGSWAASPPPRHAPAAEPGISFSSCPSPSIPSASSRHADCNTPTTSPTRRRTRENLLENQNSCRVLHAFVDFL